LQRGQQKYTVRPSTVDVWRAVAGSTVMPHTGSTADATA